MECASIATRFAYYLVHCDFGDCSYAYCASCGMTAILSMWSKEWPKPPASCPAQQEIGAEREKYLQPCQPVGRFRKGAFPRGPKCGSAFSPQLAASYIERNAPGTKKGWHWQGNWNETYCMVIESRVVNDNFRK